MPIKILVADDSLAVRTVVKNVLRDRQEFEVCGEAIDGLETLQKAEQLAPDVVLLDLAMPKINGIEAASILRTRFPKLCIIVFTFHGDSIGDLLKSALGADVILPKPEGISTVVEAIETVVASRNRYEPTLPDGSEPIQQPLAPPRVVATPENIN
jgi:DNA-binding NarL/FixJ family response regulator